MGNKLRTLLRDAAEDIKGFLYRWAKSKQQQNTKKDYGKHGEWNFDGVLPSMDLWAAEDNPPKQIAEVALPCPSPFVNLRLVVAGLYVCFLWNILVAAAGVHLEWAHI